MPRRTRPGLPPYTIVWLFAMFDLPVYDKQARKRYAQFRKRLLSLGFSMLQFSVYARHCRSEESSRSICGEVRAALPDEGQVRLVMVTDRQFAKMEVFVGRKRRQSEEPPAQFMLF